MLGGCNILIAKENHQMIALCPGDFRNGLVADLLGQINAVNFSTNIPGNGVHFDRFKCHFASLLALIRL